MQELHFDRWQFDGRGNRPVSARYTRDGWVTPGISWRDYSAMNTKSRVPVYDRRLPVPQWSLNDKMLSALVVMFVQNRARIHNPDYSLIDRREAAEKIIRSKIPGWIATIDRLQLEYVAAQHDGTPKERRDELECEIENLDTLVRMTQKGTTAVVAGVAVLYYRMGKNSVEVAAELEIKPPHVRQILYRLHRIWDEYLKEDFMVENEAPVVPACRTLTREEINEKLASGEIKIPEGPAPIKCPSGLAPSLQGENRKERRARLKAAGLCGNCGLNPRGEYADCEHCRKYYRQLSAKKRNPELSKPEPPAPRHVRGEKIDWQRAAELRKTGMSYNQIAAELGISSGANACVGLQRAGLWLPTRNKLLQAQPVPKKSPKDQEPKNHKPRARRKPARTMFQKYFGWMKWPR